MEKEIKFSLDVLKQWFQEEKRDFPWRKTPSPYAIWVSEVMLQQTQAIVVIPHFQRWMEQFPTIETLARAPIDTVIKLWEGLGYYSRARALHEGARYFVDHHGGKLPMDPNLLAQVKGIGPYTVGAICSFAFHQKAPAVDGNVLRVMSRLFCIEEEIDQINVKRNITQKVFELLPDLEPWVIMEALIELGARICTRKPACEQCPMQEACQAYLMGKADELPKRKKRPEVIHLRRMVPIIYHETSFLVQRHIGKKVMAGLYEFPFFEEKNDWKFFYTGKLHQTCRLKEVRQTFTRFRAHLFPTLWKAEEKREVEGFSWVKGSRLNELPFSSGHRRILLQLLEEHADLTY